MHISANTSPVRENAGWNEAWQQSCSTQMGCVKTFPETWFLQTKQSVELEVLGLQGGKSPTISSFWSPVCYSWLAKQTNRLLVDRRRCHQQKDISKCSGITHCRVNTSPWQLTHKSCCGCGGPSCVNQLLNHRAAGVVTVWWVGEYKLNPPRQQRRWWDCSAKHILHAFSTIKLWEYISTL